MADNTTKVDVGGNSSSKSHIEVPNNLKQLKKLGIRKLRSLCGQLQLEKEGTKTVLLDRIAAHLKIEICGRQLGTEQRKVAVLVDADLKKCYEKVVPLNRLRVEWKKDCRAMPCFDLLRLKNYLIHSTDKTFDNDSLKAYKTLRAYALFDEGHLDNLEFYVDQKSPFCFFRYVLRYIYSIL